MMSMDDPLILLFGIMLAIAIGCGGGFVLGTTIGRTRPATPLATTLRLTREALASVSARLEKAAVKLSGAQRPEHAGTAVILGRRLAGFSQELGRIERKAKVPRGESP